jgi:hypothetical protein
MRAAQERVLISLAPSLRKAARLPSSTYTCPQRWSWPSAFYARPGSGEDPLQASRNGCRVFRSRVRRPVGLFRSPSSPSGVESSPGSSVSHFTWMARSKLPELPCCLHALIHELDVEKSTAFDEDELLSHGRYEAIQTSALQKSQHIFASTRCNCFAGSLLKISPLSRCCVNRARL